MTGITATDLNDSGLSGTSRNDVVAAVLTACVQGLAEFEREALKPFLATGGEADALHGKAVSVTGGQGVSEGVAAGIDMHGALLIETPEGVQRFLSGDVSVRRV